MNTDEVRKGAYGTPTRETVLALCYALDTARKERDSALTALGDWSRTAGSLSIERDVAVAERDAARAAHPDTLEAAKLHVREHLDDGLHCPCCGQFAKVYKRALNAPMAAWLLWLVKAYMQEQRWYDFREGPTLQSRKGGGDFAKLVHWDMIETLANTDNPAKRSSGLYKPTLLGISFAKGWVEVQSHVTLYNNHCLGFTGKQITVQDALGTQFDYAELMEGVFDTIVTTREET